MKVPLRYQMTEYDCGPTSLLNAMSFLFEREELPPELVRNIMLYSMFESEDIHPYAFGPYDTREAVLLFNGKTMLTEENTVEYFI